MKAAALAVAYLERVSIRNADRYSAWWDMDWDGTFDHLMYAFRAMMIWTTVDIATAEFRRVPPAGSKT
jgi:hypothetical protein